MKRGSITGLGTFARYFALKKDSSLSWYEEVIAKGANGETTEELRYAGGLELRDLTAIKREKPESEVDYSFRVVTQRSSVRIDPGSKAAFDQWQEGLMAAMSAPPSGLRS